MKATCNIQCCLLTHNKGEAGAATCMCARGFAFMIVCICAFIVADGETVGKWSNNDQQ